jgi:hypothetical protein
LFSFETFSILSTNASLLLVIHVIKNFYSRGRQISHVCNTPDYSLLIAQIKNQNASTNTCYSKKVKIRSTCNEWDHLRARSCSRLGRLWNFLHFRTYSVCCPNLPWSLKGLITPSSRGQLLVTIPVTTQSPVTFMTVV